jgi:hypothetical protein
MPGANNWDLSLITVASHLRPPASALSQSRRRAGDRSSQGQRPGGGQRLDVPVPCGGGFFLAAWRTNLTWKKDTPLLKSGLLGPVVLFQA